MRDGSRNNYSNDYSYISTVTAHAFDVISNTDLYEAATSESIAMIKDRKKKKKKKKKRDSR